MTRQEALASFEATCAENAKWDALQAEWDEKTEHIQARLNADVNRALEAGETPNLLATNSELEALSAWSCAIRRQEKPEEPGPGERLVFFWEGYPVTLSGEHRDS